MVLKKLKQWAGGSMDDEVEKRRKEAEERERRDREQASQATATSHTNPEPAYVPPEPAAPTGGLEPTIVADIATASSDQGANAPVSTDEPTHVEAQQETYRVESGDTLSAIAQRFYGDAGQYMRIFEANQDKLDNPDMIHPGQDLVIPR
jgi:nucleoid-associated protein YgaU